MNHTTTTTTTIATTTTTTAKNQITQIITLTTIVTKTITIIVITITVSRRITVIISPRGLWDTAVLGSLGIIHPKQPGLVHMYPSSIDLGLKGVSIKVL